MSPRNEHDNEEEQAFLEDMQREMQGIQKKEAQLAADFEKYLAQGSIDKKIKNKKTPLTAQQKKITAELERFLNAPKVLQRTKQKMARFDATDMKREQRKDEEQAFLEDMQRGMQHLAKEQRQLAAELEIFLKAKTSDEEEGYVSADDEENTPRMELLNAKALRWLKEAPGTSLQEQKAKAVHKPRRSSQD